MASDYKADFVLFPELLTAQLVTLVKAPRPGLAARKIAEFTKRHLELFTGLAIKHNVNIVGGSHFTHEGETLHNVSYLFRRDGTLGKQYEMHITRTNDAGEEWRRATPSRSSKPTGGRSPSSSTTTSSSPSSRIAADKGAQILFVPFGTDSRYGYMRVRTCTQARCVENHVYAAIAGCVGTVPLIENSDKGGDGRRPRGLRRAARRRVESGQGHEEAIVAGEGESRMRRLRATAGSLGPPEHRA